MSPGCHCDIWRLWTCNIQLFSTSSSLIKIYCLYQPFICHSTPPPPLPITLLSNIQAWDFKKTKKQLALLLKRLQKRAICITLFRMYQLSLCGKPKKRTPPSLIWIFLKHAKWEQYSVRPVLTPARHQAWLLHRAACYSRVCCSKRATRKAMSSHPRTT